MQKSVVLTQSWAKWRSEVTDLSPRARLKGIRTGFGWTENIWGPGINCNLMFTDFKCKPPLEFGQNGNYDSEFFHYYYFKQHSDVGVMSSYFSWFIYVYTVIENTPASCCSFTVCKIIAVIVLIATQSYHSFLHIADYLWPRSWQGGCRTAAATWFGGPWFSASASAFSAASSPSGLWGLHISPPSLCKDC